MGTAIGGFTADERTSRARPCPTWASSQHPANTTQLFVSATLSNLTAGQTTSLTITAEDSLGYVVTGFSDTVTLTDSVAGATFGAMTFTNGLATVTATLDSAGIQTITASDTTVGTVTAGISIALTVSPAAASRLLVSGSPASLSAGSATALTITAEDQFGNVVTNFTDSVSLTDSLGGASFAAVTFASGVATVAATLETAGVQTITASDTTAGSVTAGTSNPLTISAAAAAKLLVSTRPQT